MQGKANSAVYRPLPCPDWDMQALESWLTERAAQGEHLQQDGIFLGFAAFERGAPKAVRYRLEGRTNRDDTPEEEALELCAGMGWEYTARRGDFFIFRTEDAAAPELHTDARVQESTLRAVSKRQRGSLFTTISWILIYPLLSRRGIVLLPMIEVGSWFVLLGWLLLLSLLGSSICAVAGLSRLRRKLLSEGTIDHGKDWRRGRGTYYLRRIAWPLALLAWGIWGLCLWSADADGRLRTPLAEFEGTPPFAVMADLGEGSFALSEMDYGDTNTVRVWSDVLAAQAWDWDENGTLTLTDGGTLSGSLMVRCYELRAPWLARAAAREWEWQDRGRGGWFFSDSRYKRLEEPAVEADWLACYADPYGFQTVVVQKGCFVLHAVFYQYQSSDTTLPYSTWSALLCESLGK